MKDHHLLSALALAFSACIAGCDDESGDKSAMDAGAMQMDAGRVDDGGSDGSTEDGGFYTRLEGWLCHPDAPGDLCSTRGAGTEVKPDRSLGAVPAATREQKLDCFYVYPTVNLEMMSSRTSGFANIEDIRAAALSQAAPFSDVCRVYAPLYNQIKIGAYFDAANRDRLLEETYLEVEAAFLHYLAHHNDNRQVVLIGHSQGAHILRRLLQRHFDGTGDMAMRQKLTLAILLGAIGDITVPPGKLIGGTFQSIPVCSAAGQKGCVISYSTYPASKPPTEIFGAFVGGVPAGQQVVCTNPASLTGGKAPSAGAVMPTVARGNFTGTLVDFNMAYGITTYFTVFRQYYSLECKLSSLGQGYLAVSVEPANGDQRADPIEYDSAGLSVDLIGLHVLDFNLALDDLVALVRARVQ